MAKTLQAGSGKYAATIGLDEWIKKFKQIQYRLTADESLGALFGAAEELKTSIEGKAPVLTGNLKSQVFVGKGKKRDGRAKQMSIVLGTKYAGENAPYATTIEYGDEHRAPQPFYRPGIRQGRPAYQDALLKRLQGIVKGILG